MEIDKAKDLSRQWDRAMDMIDFLMPELKQIATGVEALEPIGNCAKTAGQIAQYLEGPASRNGLKCHLVHGVVEGHGPIEGQWHFHAWVEIGEGPMAACVELSNGHEVVVPRCLHQKVGSRKHEFYYDVEAWAKKMISSRHWGPWEEVFDEFD